MGHRAVSSAPSRAACLVVSFLAIVFANGCSCERDPGAVDVASTPAESVPGATAAPHETPGLSGPSLPAEGRSIVRAGADGITVLAVQAPRLPLLHEVRELAGFRLEIAEAARLDGTVTVEAVDATLHEVLGGILDGVPYAVFHGVDAKSAGPVVERVFVGEFAGLPTVAAAVPHSPEQRRARRARKRPVQTEEDRQLRAERRERDNAAYLAQLDDPDVSARAEAAEWIRADDDTIPALTNALASDPEATVRAAAAATLADASDSSEGLSALLRALEDPAPEVVITALDSIEFVADHTVIPELGFLLDHPNEEVRERTVEAIGWLEE